MTSEHLRDLCCLVVEDLYGTFLAHIFRQLAEHGRLLGPHIAQRCRVPLRQVRAGLATLIQLRLVQQYSTDDGFSAYQTNLTNAYSLLRIGKLASLAHRGHGATAARVVQQLASTGFSTTLSLVAAVQDALTPSDTGPDDHELAMTRRKIINSMKSLAEDEFFALVQPAQLQIPHDARQDADEHVNKNPPATDSKLKGRKAQEQHVGHVDSEMEQRLDSYLAPQTLGSALDVVPAKVDGIGMPGPNDLYICVNYTRVVKSTRDSVFSQHVNKDLGESNVKIASAVLKQVDLTANSVSLAHSAPEYQLLNKSQLIKDLERPGHDHTHDNSPRTNGWHHDEEMANGIAESNGDIHREAITQCLEVVAECPYGILKGDSGDVWRLYTTGLRKYLIRQEIMKIARQRVGGIGVRLLRILIDKGRLDEKLIQETGLLSARDMRQTLSSLHTMGFIELQEVPKDAQRQPNRTMYLWFYDEVRIQKALLEELYKTMVRLYQRLQHERGKMKPTLEKVARLGCEGREEDYMIPAEVLLLQQYQRKENWLLGEISRLDDSVALLRDL